MVESKIGLAPRDSTGARPCSILVVDPDEAVRNSLKSILTESGYQVRLASNATDGLKIVGSSGIDLTICELKMPDVDGLVFLERCRKINPEMAVFMASKSISEEVTLQALRSGAYDFLPKPLSPKDLLFTIKKFEERINCTNNNGAQKEPAKRRFNFNNIIAQSKEMLSIFETIKRLAQFKTTVLIAGESGSGKELIARAIHYNSERRSQAFIAINCGAIPENLIESELFGHKKGSFTDANRDKPGLFQEADGGTIFLDEIGELPLQLQVKLLRVLQEHTIRPVGSEELRPIDVRIIAATHRDLEDDVMTGRFREDLFYRLNVVTLRLPALRERPEDITPLVSGLIEKHNKRLGLSIETVSSETIELLKKYSWPGNVRELENCIERAMVLTDGKTITPEALPNHIRAATQILTLPEDEPTSADEDTLSIKERVRRVETSLIKKALARTKGNRTHAAKLLEISHRTLLYKLKEYGLSDVEK